MLNTSMTQGNTVQVSRKYLSEIKQTLKRREEKAANKRRYTRFDHHSGTMVQLKISQSLGESLTANAFITDESFGGLGLLVPTSDNLSINQLCEILMPGIGWIEGRIAWLRALDNSMQEMGIKYNMP
ncbi:MAG: hypothetical protein AB4058_16655 [Microcystaceae cyanobacterium]